MKRTLFIILAVVAVFLVIGFSFASFGMGGKSALNSVSRDLGYGGGGGAPFIEAPAATQAPALAPMPEAAADAYSSTSAGQAAQERLVIQNADLTIVVTDPKQRMKEISELANAIWRLCGVLQFVSILHTRRQGSP